MHQPSPPWPARWPGYLPFPHAIPRSRRPVPNASAIHWATSQFAPEWLPPGSPPFQPYRFPDGPMTRPLPLYTASHSGDLQPFTPPATGPDWLFVQDPEALVQDTLQKLGQSPWLDGKTGRPMQTISSCGCGPAKNCGCSGKAKTNPISFFTKHDSEGVPSLDITRVVVATVLAALVWSSVREKTSGEGFLDGAKDKAFRLMGGY